MNIVERKIKSLDLIVNRHIQEFEQQILNTYFELANFPTRPNRPADNIPDLVEDMLHGFEPKFIAAGILAYEHDDEDRYFKVTENMSEAEAEDYLLNELDTIDERYFYNHVLPQLHGDIETILNHHNLVFINSWSNPFAGKIHKNLENSPITGVW